MRLANALRVISDEETTPRLARRPAVAIHDIGLSLRLIVSPGERKRVLRQLDYQKNRDKELIRTRAWYEKNKERANKRDREYYARNRESVRATNKDWRNRNKERIAEYERNPDRLEKKKLYAREWRKRRNAAR